MAINLDTNAKRVNILWFRANWIVCSELEFSVKKKKERESREGGFL